MRNSNISTIQNRKLAILQALWGSVRRHTAGVRRCWRQWQRRPVPIAYKLSFVISLLIIAGMSVLGSVVVTNQDQLLRSKINALGLTVSMQMAESAKELILADDALGLTVLTSNLTSDENILGTAVIDAQGSVLAQSGALPFQDRSMVPARHTELLDTKTRSLEWRWNESPSTFNNVVSFITPVRFREVIPGYVVVTFSRASLDQALHDSVRAITAATVLMIILAVVISFLMAKRLSRPIHSLMNASKAIGSGNLGFRIQERRNDEIGNLIDAFNSMADGLLKKTQVEAAFSRYVSSSVASQILSDLEHVKLGGKHVRGTVLFADIVGFTTISERMSPTDTAELLNEYFYYIGKASELYRGTIDKYMGDCAMVVFGIHDGDPEHRFNAVACAILIQKVVDSLNAQRIADGKFPIQFRLGLNTGEMLAGNMGSADRMEYTVVGDSVNLASRLCTFAGPGQIVISGEFYTKEHIKQRVVAKEHRPIRLRSKQHPVPTYLVQDLTPEYRDVMDRQIQEILGEKAVA